MLRRFAAERLRPRGAKAEERLVLSDSAAMLLQRARHGARHCGSGCDMRVTEAAHMRRGDKVMRLLLGR